MAAKSNRPAQPHDAGAGSSLVGVVAFNSGTAAEAAGLSRRTIDEAVKSGDLPATKAGRRYVILRDDLVAWLRRCKARGRVPTPISDQDRERLAALNRARRQGVAA